MGKIWSEGGREGRKEGGREGKKERVTTGKVCGEVKFDRLSRG